MKYTDKQKLKVALNENLSSTAKALQQETALKADSTSTVESDSDTALHLTVVLEAAFIHGLKEAYFEKHKRSKELPKPQFWDLICKISHKDTLTQVHKLHYIRTRVGQCRAWLRLALNESALWSYLSSLVQTKEYKSIVCRYYDVHALLRDQEQCDIFLQYLQGIENLNFELSCNSSILNSWTRTPLELAGIIAASSKKRILLPNGNLNLSKSLGITHSPSWGQLQLSSSGSHSRQSSLTNSFQLPLSSSPAMSYSSQMSGSLSSLHVFPVSEVENMVEVPPETGQASPPPNDIDPNLQSEEPVLHRRHLARRKNGKRRKKQLVDDLLSSGSRSRCSSISSLSSTASNGNVLLVKDDQGETVSSSSVSSGGSGGLTNHVISEGLKSFKDKENNTDRIAETPKRLKSSLLTNPNNTTHKNNTDMDGGFTYNKDRFTAGKRKSGDNETAVKFSHETKSLNDTPTKRNDPVALQDARLTNDVTPAHDVPDGNIEDIDIYAMHSSVSSSTHLDTIDEREPPSTPVTSPGYGNSLICGVGWSSDNSVEAAEQKKIASLAPVLSPPTSTAGKKADKDKDITSPASSTIYERREGYLKKKGDLLFWRVRWFVLSGEALSYFKDQKSSEELEILHLVDVDSIDAHDIAKTKSICLKMLNGEEHHLAAENLSLITDWCKDIRRAVEEAKADNSAYNLDSVENTYEVVEAYDVNKDSQFATPDNTSWFASMKSHMTKIANEKGLDAQNYQCADCASPIGMIYGTPRVCSFTGQYYCHQCHQNDEHLVPARMIHNWDFKKHKVARRSKKFIMEMWKEPCVDMNQVNPAAYRHLSELQKLLPLRMKLIALHPYISTCRLIPVGEYRAKLRGRYYMFDNPHLYSAHDLRKAVNDGLYDVIRKAVTSSADHVISCELCSSKGFICEVCRSNEPIFAFQTEHTSQCEECNSVYHKDCLPDLSKCRKCQRRNRRLEEEDDAYIRTSNHSDLLST